MKLDPEHYRSLARAILQTRPDEITCDDWLEQVGGCAEAVAAGQPVPPAYRYILEHMERCPNCDEEFRAIVQALKQGD